MPFSRCELGGITIVTKFFKTVVLPPKGHVPTVEEVLPLANVYVRFAEDGGATVVGIPISTKEYVVKRAVGAVRDGGADGLVRGLARMPDQ